MHSLHTWSLAVLAGDGGTEGEGQPPPPCALSHASPQLPPHALRYQKRALLALGLPTYALGSALNNRQHTE